MKIHFFLLGLTMVAVGAFMMMLGYTDLSADQTSNQDETTYKAFSGSSASNRFDSTNSSAKIQFGIGAGVAIFGLLFLINSRG